MRIHLAEGIEFDLDDPNIASDGLRIYVGGESGSGKSSAVASVIGQWLEQGGQVVELDAHSEHGVLAALAPRQVALVGYNSAMSAPLLEDRVDNYLAEVRAGRSLLVGLGQWIDTEPEKLDKFVFEFIRALYDWKKQHDEKPLLLAIEEAANFAPATIQKGESPKVRMFKGVVSGGRKFGLIALIATQRQAQLAHTVRAECNVKLLMRCSDHPDYKEVAKYLGDAAPSFEEFRKFKPGEAMLVCRWYDSQRIRLRTPPIAPSRKFPTFLLASEE